MNITRLPCQERCLECGQVIRSENAAWMGADYWRHFAREHGISRMIAVRHLGTE